MGEIEFENWEVGCVCKSFPLCFHQCNIGALDKVQGGKYLIAVYGCKYPRPSGLRNKMDINLVKCVVFLMSFRGMACVGRSWFCNQGQLLVTDIFPKMTKNCMKIAKQAFWGQNTGEIRKRAKEYKPNFQVVGDTSL